MDASIAIKFLTMRATAELDAAAKARADLAKAMEVPGSSLDSLMDAVLVADGKAKPWAQLLARIEKRGVREALAKAREEATSDLIEYGISLSTSMVANAQRLAEQDGLRAFLRGTNGIDIEDDAPAGDTAPADEEQPTPEPASADIPKATPAQKRTLAAIRDNGIKIREVKVGKTAVTAKRGERPRKDMVEWVVAQGWATQDNSTSLFTGQAVTLTEIGTAILAG